MQQNYNSLRELDPEDRALLYHQVDEPSVTKWSHVRDLDAFFIRLYKYHQNHGYVCMLMKQMCDLLEFVFVVSIVTYLAYGIDYDILFKRTPDSLIPVHKITIEDCILPISKCIANIGPFGWFSLIIASVAFIIHCLKAFHHLFIYWDIKQFFNVALKIRDSELDNLTWYEVQKRIRAAQAEHHMCINTNEITDLDIYHRILRKENYLVALVNKRILPPRIRLPFLGEMVYWTDSMKDNMKLLLFGTLPWSLFDQPYLLRHELKNPGLRGEQKIYFKKFVFYVALVNFLMLPLVLMWQLIHAFFNYVEIFKRDPGIFATRRWSQYGLLYLRHFNELEHELQARLSRAYRPAVKYISAFSSPLMVLFAQYTGFVAGAICAVFFILAVIDNDVLQVDYVLTIMFVAGTYTHVVRKCIPNEETLWNPETLLTNVVAHTHYLPPDWKGQAHTHRVRAAFQQLFQYNITMILESVFSPLLTPFFLIYYIYPRSDEIVEFFGNFTTNLRHVGDVCSFAQMDIRKNGEVDWQPPIHSRTVEASCAEEHAQTGKVELSLLHFTLTNPEWRPPVEAQPFIENVQAQSTSIEASRNLGDVLMQNNLDSSLMPFASRLDNVGPLSHPLYTSTSMWRTEGPTQGTVRDMTASVLYIHDQHYLQTRAQPRTHVEESTPLLFNN